MGTDKGPAIQAPHLQHDQKQVAREEYKKSLCKHVAILPQRLSQYLVTPQGLSEPKVRSLSLLAFVFYKPVQSPSLDLYGHVNFLAFTISHSKDFNSLKGVVFLQCAFFLSLPTLGFLWWPQFVYWKKLRTTRPHPCHSPFHRCWLIYHLPLCGKLSSVSINMQQ